MLQLIKVKTLSVFYCSVNLETIQVVGITAAIVYRCCVDYGCQMKWADDGACIIQPNTTNKIVYNELKYKHCRIDME